jgi:hypothetical protein
VDDVASVREVYDASYRRIVGQLVGITGSLAEAEDVVQESLLVFGRVTELRQQVHKISFSTDPGAMDSGVVTSAGSLVMEEYNAPDGDASQHRLERSARDTPWRRAQRSTLAP